MLHGRGIRTFANKTPAKDGYWENNSFKETIDQARKREQDQRRSEATKKAVDCSLYKLARFSCASAGSVDTCLALRFGNDYMAYEWTCR